MVGGRGSAFADYNNDGYVDLIIYAGNPYVSWLLFTNNKNGTFTKETTQNFRATTALNGASFGDYNNDGFLDIVSASFGQDYNGLYRNKGNANNWLQLKLVGNLSNKSAVGAKVDVYSPGLRTHQQILTNNGAHNQNSLVAQFGLGSNTAIDSVVINWPSGLRQKLTG
ncbi:MAG: CRTAC1 family protein [Flammeovirgaceae bacterium]|nr:CRTAC1 family protein [Flammeovirgaceae bacterium]